MFLIQLTIFLPLLTVLAHAQSDTTTTTTTTTTYPECCAALRTNGLSVCDFDFLGTADATTSQTACVCGIDGIDTPLNECINCMRANPQLATYADGYAAICKDYQNITTTTTTIASVTALGDNSISTAITNSTTTSATTRATTTRTSTTTAIATTTTHVPVASAVDSGNGAIGSNAPNIMLAALALLVQAGL